MSPSNESKYLLLFRGNEWQMRLTPEERQQVAEAWMAWFGRLVDQSKAVTGHPLDNKGKIVSGKGGKVVADGPFTESKEAIGGYFLLNAATMEEAIAIAQQCPGLPYGAVVEVRPVIDTCEMVKKAEEMARAQAAGAL